MSRRQRASPERLLAYAVAALATSFMLAPVYLITLAALSTPAAILRYPLALWPDQPSLDSLMFFVGFEGVLPALANSFLVGAVTVVLSLALGCPAGYAIARRRFRGRAVVQLLLVNGRAIPMIIVALPLLVTFLGWGLYDTPLSVALVHTAVALPLTVLLSASTFLRVPAELEEAAIVLGASPLGAFVRVVLRNSVPGLAASALFAFVTSWNEVLVAVVLTQNNTTLPALLVTQAAQSPLPLRYAGGFLLMLPAFAFVLLLRPYLFNALRAGAPFPAPPAARPDRRAPAEGRWAPRHAASARRGPP